MRTLRRILLVGMVLLFAGLLAGGASATLNRFEDFPETGFSVDGLYEDFFKASEDPYLYYGLPISIEIITNKTSGESLQYFQRARLEKKLDSATGNFYIEIYPVGLDLYQAGSPLFEARSGAPCRVFSDGYQICYEFLKFYESKEVEKHLGAPISNMEYDSAGRIVQYFENGRLEWRPDIPSETGIIISDAGKMHMDRMSFTPYGDIDPLSNGIIVDAGPLNVQVSTKTPAVAPASAQTIFVVVQNSAYQGVPTASVAITLSYADGSQQKLAVGYTNKDGIYQTTVDLPGNLPLNEIVEIEAKVSAGTSSAAGYTGFRILP